MTNGLWNAWGIDLDDSTARAYAAGQFDEDGQVKVTQGPAVLRVLVGASGEQVPILRKLGARRVQGWALLTGIEAHMFCQYVAPYVRCKRAQVAYALDQWEARKAAVIQYRQLVKRSAAGMPRQAC